VADFVGESNLLRGRLERDESAAWLVRGSWRWRVDPELADAQGVPGEGPAALVVRPEHLHVVAPDSSTDGRNGIEAAVTEVLYLGSSRKIELALPDGQAIVVRESAGASGDWRPGDRVRVEWSIERGVVVPDPPVG
jgi:putative spermidine/putrescine transport system ATP-binding protein